MSSRLDRIIREVLEGGESTLLEADMSRRLDMLVRQGLMPASQLPILKRGLEKFNQGKVPAPNERNAVNTLLNGMMFIVLGDDTVFNRARTSVQQKKYQTEEEKKDYDSDKEHTMDPTSHVKKEGEKFCVYDMKGKKVASFETKDEADAYAKKNHDDLMNEELEENRAAFSGAADRNRLLKKLQKTGKVADEIGEPKKRAAAKKELPKIMKQLDTGIREEEQLDEYGAMSSDKASHNTGGFRISNKDAAAAKERAKKKSAEKRDKLSNIIKKNTIQKGPMKGYMTDEVNQGEEKMDIDWTKNPFAQAKAIEEGKFKDMATRASEDERLKAEKKAKRLSDKKGREEKETDPGLKTEGVAKNTLDIYQAAKDSKDKKSLKSMEKQMDKAVDKANAKLKEELEGLPELDAMDYEMWEAYQSPTKNNYTDKELRQAKGIAFDKRYKGGNMTGAAKAMEKIKKGLSDHPVASKALRKANEENMKDEWLDLFDGVEDFNEIMEMSYKEKFTSMLKKTGKSLAGMSPEEKKKFFNKVDGAHDAVNENKAFRDAARDYSKDDKRGMAPLKKDAPKVSDAKNAKEIEHIVPQMRKAISVGKKVQFKDGKHHTVSKAHAAKFLNKYMSGKPADKEKMQSHAHASHKNFMDHAK
tara:strand:+ start:2087 stop:4015 length:1929 start_codon:yes stop_codon:yes gene_type:complete